MGKEQVNKILRIVSDRLAIHSTNIHLHLALLVLDLREEEEIRKIRSEKLYRAVYNKLTSILPFLVNGACEKL